LKAQTEKLVYHNHPIDFLLRENADMDLTLKFFQIIFYITASVITVLTFIKAKNGLLNSVNTEYQKRVMDRLASLSNELYDEFDPDSESYWAKNDWVKEVVEDFHEEIKPLKHEIITKKTEIDSGIRTPKDFLKLTAYLDKIKSDPFIPKPIREKVVLNLETRTVTIISAHMEIMKDYKNGLVDGRYWDKLDTNHFWIRNKILDRMYQNGVGISQVQEAVHGIRLDIQEYLEKFNPNPIKS
jgi:hypothetical protein